MEKLVSYLKQSSYNNNDTNENAFKSLLVNIKKLLVF